MTRRQAWLRKLCGLASQRGELPDHLERYLGRIDKGAHATDEAGSDLRFHLVRFTDRHGGPATTYATLGLSHHRLTRRLGAPARQEIVTHVAGEVNAYSWLGVLGEEALARHQSYPHGSVTGPRQPVAPGSGLTGFYFALPFFWDADFAVFGEGDDQVILTLALPVTTAEQAFVASHGPSTFEELLRASDIDLTDVHRPGVPGIH